MNLVRIWNGAEDAGWYLALECKDTMSDAQTLKQLQDTLLRKERELALANECLAQFTYGISHEINSPASTLRNLLGILDVELRDQLDAESVELLSMIMRSSNRLCDTISGVLEFSGCSRPSDTREPVDCNVLMSSILTDLAPVIERKSARITIEQMPVIDSSANCLRQLFHHLIDNALKFTKTDDASPAITIAARRTDEGYEFIISDQGQGVSADRRESIFGVFERLNLQSQHRGAGIGLALCRQIVTALGGQIWMDSTEHHGAAFHVYLNN